MKCHDCSQEIASGMEYMPYEIDEVVFAKCKPCFESDEVLRNFRGVEVYTRVVGYIRPVEQWNKGKKQEFADRKEFRAIQV